MMNRNHGTATATATVVMLLMTFYHRISALVRWILRSPVRLISVSLVGTIVVHRMLSLHQAKKHWYLAPIAEIERQCPRPSYPVLSNQPQEQKQAQVQPSPKICLTTLTDEKSKAWTTRFFGWRNFDGILQLTWENKAKYAAKHGYYLFDESNLLDKSRPPSWSKILAVQRLLREEACDWVFWMDADAVVMNSNQRIEDFLPWQSSSKHLLLAADDGVGYNAGMWLIHNDAWSLQFLQEWWNMKSFVKPPGLAKSGDNDALKYKLQRLQQQQHGDEPKFDDHILVPPRCTFNSFVKCVEPFRYEHVTQNLPQQEWYLSEAFYHKGDFIAHVAGVDNKVETIQNLLKQAI